jgi:hypothetical protein
MMKKRGVLTSENFGPPQRISVDHMRELIEGYGISNTTGAVVIGFLNELVALHQDDIKKAHRLNRGDIRKELAGAANWLKHAAKRISNSGILGTDIIRHAAPSQLSSMFSEVWLNDLLPGNALLPTRSERGSRTRIRSRLAEETEFAEASYYLMRAEGPQIIGAALSQISAALNEALDASRKKGGRKVNLYRHLFLLNLAVLWEEKLGRDCRSSEGQTFKHFCEDIFGYVNWPTDGIKRAIDKAVADYYRRSNRN